MILEDIYEFEKIISDEESDYLENYVVKLNDWKYWENINYGENKSKNFMPGWVTAKFDTKAKNIIENIKTNAFKELNLFEITPLRIKINKTSKLNISERECYSGMHVDNPNIDYPNHIILIYYINDASGETLISDLHVKNVKNLEELNQKITSGEYCNFNIIKRITPKKGKLLVFDGGLFHCGLWPTDGDRYNININSKIKNIKLQKTFT